MRILIVNPFGIGDVLFVTPLLRNLRRTFPDARIWFICNKRIYPLVKKNPFCDRVIAFEKDEWSALAKRSVRLFLRYTFAFWRQIREQRFDLLFDLTLNERYGFLLMLCGIKKRIGFDYRGRGRFLTHKKKVPDGYSEKHAVAYMLDLLTFAGASAEMTPMEVFLDRREADRVKRMLSGEGVAEDAVIVGISPGSGDSWKEVAYFKRWPREYFVKLSEMLAKIEGARIVLFGSPAENGLVSDIAQSMTCRPVNLCGRLTLTEFAATLSRCSLLVTNDGGAFHIAQALGVKTVGLFGPADERVYGAWPPAQEKAVIMTADVPCRPCYRSFRFTGCAFDRRCLSEISPDEVFAASCRLLKQGECAPGI